MAVNPWGKPNEESIEGILSRPAVKRAAKAAGDTVKAMMTDAKQQLTGDFGMQAMEQAQKQQKTLTTQQQQNIQQQSQQTLIQTRQNLEKINNEIKMIRQKKTQEKQQITKAETQKKEQKKVMEEKKKNEEPIWKKMLRSGSHEMIKNAGG